MRFAVKAIACILLVALVNSSPVRQDADWCHNKDAKACKNNVVAEKCATRCAQLAKEGEAVEEEADKDNKDQEDDGDMGLVSLFQEKKEDADWCHNKDANACKNNVVKEKCANRCAKLAKEGDAKWCKHKKASDCKNDVVKEKCANTCAKLAKEGGAQEEDDGDMGLVSLFQEKKEGDQEDDGDMGLVSLFEEKKEVKVEKKEDAKWCKHKKASDCKNDTVKEKCANTCAKLAKEGGAVKEEADKDNKKTEKEDDGLIGLASIEGLEGN